jgi:hypothetical protein
METHYQIEVTKREADLYLSIVNLALRGDLDGVKNLVRSSVGRELHRTMQGAVATARALAVATDTAAAPTDGAT